MYNSSIAKIIIKLSLYDLLSSKVPPFVTENFDPELKYNMDRDSIGWYVFQYGLLINGTEGQRKRSAKSEGNKNLVKVVKTF